MSINLGRLTIIGGLKSAKYRWFGPQKNRKYDPASDPVLITVIDLDRCDISDKVADQRGARRGGGVTTPRLGYDFTAGRSIHTGHKGEKKGERASV